MSLPPFPRSNPFKSLWASPSNRTADRDINRLRLLGLAALLICIGIAASGLHQQQQALNAADQAQGKPWTTTR
ncbi:hypothetical protein [Govanella unica]|uniref:Uncharacterized protein n=1 Tax=Govanella unica TaxID=2975056 RepID=A0A9X3TWA0_9PROT|nr:hypothetical protein [Govania unica]MDA5192867.1 hypothetical protein [Govania unica]